LFDLGTQNGGLTCQESLNQNLCCSQFGYCGSTSEYCGEGMLSMIKDNSDFFL